MNLIEKTLLEISNDRTIGHGKGLRAILADMLGEVEQRIVAYARTTFNETSFYDLDTIEAVIKEGFAKIRSDQ